MFSQNWVNLCTRSFKYVSELLLFFYPSLTWKLILSWPLLLPWHILGLNALAKFLVLGGQFTLNFVSLTIFISKTLWLSNDTFLLIHTELSVMFVNGIKVDWTARCLSIFSLVRIIFLYPSLILGVLWNDNWIQLWWKCVLKCLKNMRLTIY